MCAPDSDLDAWPDHSLNCTGDNVRCKADNCIFIPNSGQEDADSDGIGDSCEYSITFIVIELSAFYHLII